MNILDDFEKHAEIYRYLKVLKMGAMHLGADFKISEAFSHDNVLPQLQAFYKKKYIEKEALEAINWWSSLSPELRNKFDS
ncbi:hypothetical protein ACPVA0_001667 [Shigella flexneri]